CVESSASHPRREAELSTHLESITIDRPFEIRASDRIHDRFVIPESGPVRLIGTSLNGVGNKLSVSLLLLDVASSAIRAEYRDAWESARVVATTRPVESAEPDN